MNLIKQRIGVFYKDEEWAMKIWTNMLGYIDIKDIVSIDYVREGKKLPRRVRLKDGSIIRIFKAEECCKGCRLDKVYIQDTISTAFRRSVIGNMLNPQIIEMNMDILENDE